MEEGPTRAGRPRRPVGLVAVPTEGLSTTSTARRPQNIVELYGVLPTVADDVKLNLLLLSDRSQPHTGQGLANPLARVCSAD